MIAVNNQGCTVPVLDSKSVSNLVSSIENFSLLFIHSAKPSFVPALLPPSSMRDQAHKLSASGPSLASSPCPSSSSQCPSEECMSSAHCKQSEL